MTCIPSHLSLTVPACTGIFNFGGTVKINFDGTVIYNFDGTVIFNSDDNVKVNFGGPSYLTLAVRHI